MICIFLHIYYPDSFRQLFEKLQPMLGNDNYLLINFVQDTHFTMPELPEQKNIVAIRSTNKGKDIGGKLLLIDLYQRLGLKSEYMIFLHDKQSPHAAAGSFWKSELFKIVDEKNVASLPLLFTLKKKVGLAGSKPFIKNEWNSKARRFETTNHDILLSLIEQYGLLLPDYSFVAGTMFWVRSRVYENFFSKHAPLPIRATLEEGDVLDADKGSVTHAWERMLSWIATAQGYKLYGI